MENTLMIRARLCDTQVWVLIRVFGWAKVIRLPNPFRVVLSDEDFLAGKTRWRWPVSMWAHG